MSTQKSNTQSTLKSRHPLQEGADKFRKVFYFKKGNDTLTYSRHEFIKKRMEDDPFKLLEVDNATEEAVEEIRTEASVVANVSEEAAHNESVTTEEA